MAFRCVLMRGPRVPSPQRWYSNKCSRLGVREEKSFSVQRNSKWRVCAIIFLPVPIDTTISNRSGSKMREISHRSYKRLIRALHDSGYIDIRRERGSSITRRKRCVVMDGLASSGRYLGLRAERSPHRQTGLVMTCFISLS